MLKTNLSPAILIAGPQPQITIKQLCRRFSNPFSLNNPDILILKPEHSIQKIRQIKSFFAQKPFSSSTKITIIYSAHLLQIPAQNALLKTLEEPGPNRYLILAATKPRALLSTILSRCQVINLSSAVSAASKSFIPISTDPIKNLALAKSFAPDSILSLMEKEIAFLQHRLVKNPSPSLARQIKILAQATAMINHNVHPLSALDFYLLS